jgi:L-lactate dehydrogenase complex protein LldE
MVTSQTAQLFITCLIDSLFPGIGEAVVEVLARAGVRVNIPPDQTCCGQPPFNAGFHKEAARIARHTIEVFSGTQGPLILPSGSCAAMIRHGYSELFKDDPIWLPKAKALAARTYELSEFLVDYAGVLDIGARYEGKLAYHPSCHLLRELEVDRQPWTLLQHIEGPELVRLPAECCGFGGVFAVDQHEISGEMLKRKMIRVEQTGAEVVVGCDVSCLMHIEGGLRHVGSPVRCAHIAQILVGEKAGLR